MVYAGNSRRSMKSKFPLLALESLKFNQEAICKYRLLLAIPRIQPKYHLAPDARSAAVLLPLCVVGGKPSVLFTVRSSQLNSHAGEVSFPGGMTDDTDASDVETALRETMEEIGISSNNIEILGKLAHLPNVHQSVKVQPIVGFLGDIDPTTVWFNTDEVSRVFTVSIADLLIPPPVFHSFRGGAIKIPSWNIGSERIWGLTAYVLWDFLQGALFKAHRGI